MTASQAIFGIDVFRLIELLPHRISLWRTGLGSGPQRWRARQRRPALRRALRSRGSPRPANGMGSVLAAAGPWFSSARRVARSRRIAGRRPAEFRRATCDPAWSPSPAAAPSGRACAARFKSAAGSLNRSAGFLAIIRSTNPANRGGTSGRRLDERRGRLVEVLHGDGQRRVAGERRLAGQHVIGRDAERVDVAAGVELAAFDLFGAHVERRAHRDADLREVRAAVALHAGEAEVGDFHFAAAGEHDVFGLDVAVDDAFAGRFGERGGDLPQDIERELRRERAAAANDFAQIAAGDVFLRDVMDAVFLADFVNLHDAAVHERGGRPRFVMESANVVRIAGQLGVEHLECDLPAERKLLGQIDLGHRPAAQPAEDEEVFQFFANEIGHDDAMLDTGCWYVKSNIPDLVSASQVNVAQHLGRGFGAVEDVEVDAGDAGVDEGLRLLGGELDADLELGVGRVAGFFETADERRREAWRRTAT